MKNALFVASRNWSDPSQPASFHPVSSLEDAKEFLRVQASRVESLGDEVVWQFLGFVTLVDGEVRLEYRIEEYPVEDR